MKLFLVFLMICFLCLMAGSESKQVPEPDETCTEIMIPQPRITADLSENEITPGWLRSYLFILNIIDPVKQLDLPTDHDKNGHNLSGKVLRVGRNAVSGIQQQKFRLSRYWRLLSARHINGFYIYFLEKLLI